MFENLSDDDSLLVKEIIDGWPLNEKLTWEGLREAIAIRRDGKSWSRQALSRHQDIFDAYTLKKNAQRAYKGSPPTDEKDKEMPPELLVALKTIERLESEIARLKQENLRYKEMFISWSYNAHSRNITEEMLNRQLPVQDRGKSKK